MLHTTPYPQYAQLPTIPDNHPAEVVDIALQALQAANFRLLEWRALWNRRMKVPILVKVSNFPWIYLGTVCQL